MESFYNIKFQYIYIYIYIFVSNLYIINKYKLKFKNSILFFKANL